MTSPQWLSPRYLFRSRGSGCVTTTSSPTAWSPSPVTAGSPSSTAPAPGSGAYRFLVYYLLFKNKMFPEFCMHARVISTFQYQKLLWRQVNPVVQSRSRSRSRSFMLLISGNYFSQKLQFLVRSWPQFFILSLYICRPCWVHQSWRKKKIIRQYYIRNREPEPCRAEFAS